MMQYLILFSIFLKVIPACPDMCNCTNVNIICNGWSSSKPPEIADTDKYQHMDLSFEDNSKAPRKHVCSQYTGRDSDTHSLRSLSDGSIVQRPALGTLLQHNRLPDAWLGIGRYVWLRSFSLSRAEIHLIHKDAFRYQLKLKCVDLSQNQIERLNIFTWQRHLDLKILSLSENREMAIPLDAPLFYSKSLNTLYLSACDISYINELTFSQLPNITVIDLSENKLTTLSIKASRSLWRIENVILYENAWICNSRLIEVFNDIRQQDWRQQLWMKELIRRECLDEISLEESKDPPSTSTTQSPETTPIDGNSIPDEKPHSTQTSEDLHVTSTKEYVSVAFVLEILNFLCSIALLIIISMLLCRYLHLKRERSDFHEIQIASAVHWDDEALGISLQETQE